MATEDRLWTKAYILISLANFFSWLSYNMVTPVMTSYMETLGASVSICGIVGGLFAGTSLFSRPFSGIMADIFNRKWLMAIFSAVMTLSLFIYAIVPNIPLIIIFRGLHGVAFGISSTASLVLVSECTSETRMGEAISYYGVMSVASMAIGPSLGIKISEYLGYNACMLIGAVILAIATVATFLFPYVRPITKKDTAAEFAGNRKKEKHQVVDFKLMDLSLINASFTMMNGVVSTFLVAFAATRMINNVSLHFTINAIVLIVSRVVLAKKMNRWSLRQNLMPAFISAIIALVMIGCSYSLIWFVIAAVFKAVGQGMSQPALQTEALKSVPREKRGIASSTMYIDGDIGQTVGPMLGGVVADITGYGSMFILSAIPIAAAFVYFIFSKRNKCKKI